MSNNQGVTLGKKATIHQLTTMLPTSKHVLFPGHNHLLTTSANDWHFDYRPSTSEWSVIRWLWPGNRTILEVDSMVVSCWIVAFLRCVNSCSNSCHGSKMYFTINQVQSRRAKVSQDWLRIYKSCLKRAQRCTSTVNWTVPNESQHTYISC